MSTKYIVLKLDDFERIKELALTPINHEFASADEVLAMIKDKNLEDAEVIRGQDITAAPLFYTYAAIIRSYKELLFKDDGGVGDTLMEIADWAMDAAHVSENRSDRKLPD